MIDPQQAGELTTAARALLTDPWRPAEADRDLFILIRRHANILDRWFTQRFGYRLVVNADTARLVKSGYVPRDRPLLTRTKRAFTGREYITLALVLAATASGPDRISLRDLVLQVRSAAADAGVSLDSGVGQRRALVTVLRWLIDRCFVRELDRSVGGYETDADADALLEVRNDRLAMLAAPALNGPATAEELLDCATDASGSRAALRRRLVEDPVLYAADLSGEDWAELRRRLGEEGRYAAEMFGLELEARAEGVAAIDVEGGCTDILFPAGGTTGHAALLLLAALVARYREGATREQVDTELAELITAHGRHWRKDVLDVPAQLRDDVLTLLAGMQLIELRPDGMVRPRPAAARYVPEISVVEPVQPDQETLL